MSTITLTKKLRVFDWDKDAEEYATSKGFRAQLVKGALKRRPVPLPAEPRINAGPCAHCGLPVMASQGQIILYAIVTRRNGSKEKLPTHKPCRKARKW